MASVTLQLAIEGNRLDMKTLNAEIASGKVDVSTLKGLQTYAVGVSKVTLTGTGIIINGGLDSGGFNFWNAALPSAGEYRFQFIVGGQQVVGMGWFNTVSLSQSEGQGAEVSFTATCRALELK